jgi:hypothetical protein
MTLNSPVMRDGDPGFIGFASRMNPMNLPAGMLQMAENVRLDRGVAQTRKGAKRVAADIATGQEPLTFPFDFGVDIAATFSATGSAVTATTATNHGYTSGDQVAVEGVADSRYNGDYTITVTGLTTFTYTATLAPTSPTGSGTVNKGPIVRSSYTGGIFAAGVYSSPVYENGKEYAVVCGPGSAYLWSDESGLAETIGYPSSPDETIDATDTVSVVQAFDRLYVLREAAIDPATSYKQQYTNGSGISVSVTTATVNVDAHGLIAGDTVRIEGSTVAAFDGHEYRVLGGGDAPTTNAFKVAVPSGTSDHVAANIKVRKVKCPIYWDGVSPTFTRSPAGVPDEGPTYRRLRSVGWAVFINNRFVVPDGRDSVALSDILDANLFDPYWSTFRANQGSNDYIVAIHPWVEGSFLVFMRRSIWLAEINALAVSGSDDTLISRLTLLTDEVGCVARKSIATAGQFVYFLSDAGVYRLDSRLDLKLRGDTKPLSDAIADQFAGLNAVAAAKSVGIWFDNRYYIAVPKSAEADSADTVYIYNALNEAWESKDTYGFGVQDFLVTVYNDANRLLISNRAGVLMVLDENEDGDSAADSDISALSPVESRIVTRRYMFGQLGDKRYLRTLAEVVMPANSTMTAEARTTNPDRPVALRELTTTTAQDYTFKQPIRAKAHGVELELGASAGRPSVRAIMVEAAGKGEEPTETRNVA